MSVEQNKSGNRSSLQVAISVWRALFLREALSRISGGRAPWAWLLLEPVIHIAYMAYILTALRHRVVGGLETTVWVLVGMLSFFLFRRPALQGMAAVSANRALFVYRQVRPADTVVTRAVLEGFLMLLVSVVVLASAGLMGVSVLPDDPLLVLAAVFGLWLLGLGFGLLFSVPVELVPGFDYAVKFIMTPIYLISGVLFPIAIVPYPFRDWLLYNPVVHGLEAARLGYGNYYHAVSQVDVGYLYSCALIAIFMGLALHIRHVERLIAR